MSELEADSLRTPEVELFGESGHLFIRRVNHVPLNRHLVAGRIEAENMPEVIQALAQLPLVTLDGRPTTIGGPLPGVCVRVRDVESGVLARLEQDPKITEVFVNGALRCGQVLHPIGAHGLHDKAFKTLRRGRKLRPEEYERFVDKVLPGLRKALPVYIESTVLSGGVKLRPYLLLKTSREDDVLHTQGDLVYGKPPIARIVEKQLVLAQDAPMPGRDLRHEELLAEHLQDQFGMTPGQRITVKGGAAHILARRICDAGGEEVEVEGNAHHIFARQHQLIANMRWEEDGPQIWFQTRSAAAAQDPSGDGTQSEASAPSGEGLQVDAGAALEAWYRGDNYLFSDHGGLLELPQEWLEQHADSLAAVLAQRPGKERPLAPHLVEDLRQLSAALDRPATGQWKQRLSRAIDRIETRAATLPEDLKAELRHYQLDGVSWLQTLRDAGLGALLADDMGLGKTLQALCTVRGKTLIVTPTSVLHGWADEIDRFRPSLTYTTYHGPQRHLDDESDVVLTTYTILRLDRAALAQRRWDCVILDEAQTIKNANSQVAQAVFELHSDFRLALTGTPIENRLEDLWSQFHFLNRGLLGGRRDFLRRYSQVENKNEEDSRMQRLRQRIAPFILRRRKSEVLAELPPRTEVQLRVELNEQERDIYQTVFAATREDLVARVLANASVLEVLEALLRLRQAACHPALVPGYAQLNNQSSAKTRELVGILKEITAEGHKALVFSQWTSFMDLIGQQLKEAGIAYLRLDGSTRNRGDVVRGFQEGDEAPVLLASLRAGGTGLNLTAADHVFLMDPWWNPAVEDQAADRAHRLGQQNPVMIHRLIADDTIEQKVLSLQQHKRRLAASALDAGSQQGSLTKDELLALLDIR